MKDKYPKLSELVHYLEKVTNCSQSTAEEAADGLYRLFKSEPATAADLLRRYGEYLATISRGGDCDSLRISPGDASALISVLRYAKSAGDA